MNVIVSFSGSDVAEELPKPTGMPMMDVNEISRMIAIEKPRVLSLLGKRVLVSHVRRRLENEHDRPLLEFLNLYANRLRRWMEQSIYALRNAFTAFADLHRARFEAAPASVGATNMTAVENDLRILHEWDTANAAVISKV
jgi:hypothetical protein